MVGRIRLAIERWMRDEHTGAVPRAALYLLSLLYGAAVRIRASFFAIGLIRPKKLPCKVVSVGNLTVGGCGKTPMAMHIASLLQKKGKKTVILSRGYKGSARGVNAVSDGASLLLGCHEAGDEPYLMARRLKGVPVVVGRDRYKSGLYAIKAFSPDVILLDDGYQHIRLKRDVNILLVDSKEGFGNGHLLPRGILREPVSGIKRADIAMVKGGGLKPDDLGRLKGRGLKPVKFSYTPSGITCLRDLKEYGPGRIKGAKVLAIAGIASPGPFFEMLEGMGAAVAATMVFPDHHSYSARDVEEMKKIMASSGAEFAVTTEKDGVKLEGVIGEKTPIWALRIDTVISDEAGFERLLNEIIDVKGPT